MYIYGPFLYYSTVSPAVSLRFSLELNSRVRVKSESTFILSRSLGKFQPGRGKPVVCYNNSFMVHKLPSPQTFTVPESL